METQTGDRVGAGLGNVEWLGFYRVNYKSIKTMVQKVVSAE